MFPTTATLFINGAETQFPRFTYLSKAILKLVHYCVKIFVFLSSCALPRLSPCSMSVGKINVREWTVKRGSKTLFQKHVIKIRETSFSLQLELAVERNLKRKKNNITMAFTTILIVDK